jgi:hypothetical protein
MVNGVEDEQTGINFCKSICGENTNWKQTSYNSRFRKNYAGIGYKYHTNIDAFVPPKPFDSWTLDEQRGAWIAPIPLPDLDNYYEWNELNESWVKVK